MAERFVNSTELFTSDATEREDAHKVRAEFAKQREDTSKDTAMHCSKEMGDRVVDGRKCLTKPIVIVMEAEAVTTVK